MGRAFRVGFRGWGGGGDSVTPQKESTFLGNCIKEEVSCESKEKISKTISLICLTACF